MDAGQWLGIAVVMLLASALQSAVGFGFSLFAVPSLLFLGVDLPETVAICILTSFVQRIVAVTHLRRAVDWRELAPMILVGVAALPIGVFMLHRLSLNENLARQAVGACILLILLVQWLARIEPRDVVPRRWGYLAGFSSGVLGGLANIGGPPIVMWILFHNWPNAKMRVTTLAYSLGHVPVQILLLLLAFGSRMLPAWGIGLAAAPLVLAGSWVGLKLGNRIEKDRLRIVFKALLVLVALLAFCKPFFHF